MSALLIASLVGLSQGLLHGLGPDHCAAIATLTTASKRRPWEVALRFALGHSAVLACVAGGCLLFGVGVSETVTRWTEALGGIVLIGLALAALFFPGFLQHGHPHLPPHGDDHRHNRLGTAAGALMALSGVRALMLAMPPLLVGGSFSLAGWSYLPAFALGVFVSMAAVGLLFGRGRDALGRRGLAPLLERAVAVSTGALGVFWIAVA